MVDHDFTKISMIPFVSLLVDIPDDSGSWYMCMYSLKIPLLSHLDMAQKLLAS